MTVHRFDCTISGWLSEDGLAVLAEAGWDQEAVWVSSEGFVRLGFARLAASLTEAVRAVLHTLEVVVGAEVVEVGIMPSSTEHTFGPDLELGHPDPLDRNVLVGDHFLSVRRPSLRRRNEETRSERSSARSDKECIDVLTGDVLAVRVELALDRADTAVNFFGHQVDAGVALAASSRPLAPRPYTLEPLRKDGISGEERSTGFCYPPDHEPDRGQSGGGRPGGAWARS